ncbi:HAMP domain-containing histidine kinase [bacterium]|nr:MAG: HAMP domain-containing histidine kinase [bacterium]
MTGKRIGLIAILALLSIVSMVSIHSWLSSQEDAQLLNNVFARQLSGLWAGVNQQSIELINDYITNFDSNRAKNQDGSLKAIYQYKNESFTLISGEYVEQDSWIQQALQAWKSNAVKSDLFFVFESEKWLILGKKSENRLLVLSNPAFIRYDFFPMIRLLNNDYIQYEVIERSKTGLKTILSEGEIIADLPYIEREFWFSPSLNIRMQMESEQIQTLSAQRSFRSWLVIGLIVLVLGITFGLLFRFWKKEQHITQLKTDFVANVSHELKTPLALIRMNAETLSLGRVPTEEKRQHYLRVIEQEAERLGHLINNVLNFSKLESGKKEFQTEMVSVNDVLAQVEDSYRSYVERLGFSFDVQLPETQLYITSNKNDMIEILLNLLDNAVKYSLDKKHIQIDAAKELSTVRISVKDSGMGIPREWQQSIFEPFVRIENSLTQKTKGTGLGLSLVKRMVSAYHGTIQVESEPENGTTIILNFPLA